MANQIQSCFERYEKKYMLTPAQLRVRLTGMKAHLVPDQYGKYTICNIYYDTPDWRLIRASLEKPVYKEKLRVRSYGVAAPDGKVFVEIKKKFDGVVYKRRITAPAPPPALPLPWPFCPPWCSWSLCWSTATWAPAWPSPGPSAWCASAPPPAPPGRSPACSCPWP